MVPLSVVTPLEDTTGNAADIIEALQPIDFIEVTPGVSLVNIQIDTPLFGGFLFVLFILVKFLIGVLIGLFPNPNDQFVAEMIQTIMVEIAQTGLDGVPEMKESPPLSLCPFECSK